MGRLDPLRHRIDYHAAGQGPLLHFHARDQSCEWHPASTLPLGVMPDMVVETPPPVVLAPGDLFVLLTDGFYEYQDAAGEQLGKDRIGEIVRLHHAEPVQVIFNAVLDELHRFAAGAPQMDDLTAVVVKRT